MRWTLFRRRPKDAAEVATSPRFVERQKAATGSLERETHLTDGVMRFARDYLVTAHAKVRVEGSDLLVATREDGEERRYTSSIARAHSESGVELLAPGGAALEEMLSSVESQARVTALRLAETFDAREAIRRMAHVVPNMIPLPESLRIDRADDALAVELTYEIHARWRGGASHDWVTVCLDAQTLDREQHVESELIGRASASTLPPEAIALYERVSAAADRALNPTLAAAGRWLSLRSGSDFAERLDDLRNTAERLARETPEQAELSREAFRREAQRLRDVFAVTVEATLSRVCFITSPVCIVQLSGKQGEHTFRVDMGRGIARPLIGGSEAAVPQSIPSETAPSVATLTVADLALLPERLWREAIIWLLEHLGHSVEEIDTAPASLRVYTSAKGRPALVIAMRREPGRTLDSEYTQAAIAQSATTGREPLLLTPNDIDAEARVVIERAGLHVIGPEILASELDRLSHAYVDRREATREQAEALAMQAAKVRAQILEHMESLETALVRTANARRATGAEVARAALIVRETQSLADQVFVAWETLLVDWQALFPTRAARDGSMRILAGDKSFTELSERAEHLFGVTRQGFARLEQTPEIGEMGYTSWRRAAMEDMTARCESVRWRIQAIDPTRWRDFASVRDTRAMERAETALSAAAHARARADKAYAQLATRARIEK